MISQSILYQIKARQKLHIGVSLEQSFPMNVSKCFASCAKMYFVSEDFDHQNSLFVQKKSDIRNQHQKLHLISLIFYPKKFTSKFDCILSLNYFLPDLAS